MFCWSGCTNCSNLHQLHNTTSHSDLAELAVNEDLNDKETIKDEDIDNLMDLSLDLGEAHNSCVCI